MYFQCIGKWLVLAALMQLCAAWRQPITWSVAPWCDQVKVPTWPFAYSKRTNVSLHPLDVSWELKGRSSPNTQWLGHQCALKGSRSSCFRCEIIKCGVASGPAQSCNMQIQGTVWKNLPKNVATLTDVPFAAGPNVQHRYDFGNAERVCLMIGNTECGALQPLVGFNSTTRCAVRCWGWGNIGRPTPNDGGWQYLQATPSAQGRVTTLAGHPSTAAGLVDGAASTSRFFQPQGIAVDSSGAIYVADSKNHIIRRIWNGTVSSFAGSGVAGYRDGSSAFARFSFPTGIAAFDDCAVVAGVRSCSISIIVSDTFNHRIRKVTFGTVSTIAGGANLTENELDANPNGFTDGQGVLARFDTPMGIAVDSNGNIFVADTRNHVIRHVDASGAVTTLAGKLVPQEQPLPGCPLPCMSGRPGYKDGAASEAEFYSPYDVAIGPGNPATLLVVDGSRVRLVTRVGQQLFSETPASYVRNFSTTDIDTLNLVITVAGSLQPGDRDWYGEEAQFDVPRAVSMSPAEDIFIADSSRCRIRRIAAVSRSAVPATCGTTMEQLIRPSGCNSRDLPTDKLDHQISEASAGIFYNYNSSANVRLYNGRRTPTCIGTAPVDMGLQSIGMPANATGGTLSAMNKLDEDQIPGTVVLVSCPTNCTASATSTQIVWGSGPYGFGSSVCWAAVHAGVLTNSSRDGVLSVTIWKGEGTLQFNAASLLGSTKNGVVSASTNASASLFTLDKILEPYNQSLVHTIAGAPAAPLDSPCGYLDAETPAAAQFTGPAALAYIPSAKALAVADTRNNLVRLISASCTQACENGGTCIDSDLCNCTGGWSGPDCTTPVCAAACGVNRICSGPNQCSCFPGYSGVNCTIAQCVQTCANGGLCIAPDTCACATGWFDANCTTPVCTQTCGNGGNCTAADTCTCPSLWSGTDCRTPVCPQGCTNGGVCVAPNTCQCLPSWSGHDCSKPVCHQGLFMQDPVSYSAPSSWRQASWNKFVPCTYSGWCNSTNEFDCVQQRLTATPSVWPANRRITGTLAPQSECFFIEIFAEHFTPFRYLTEWDNFTTFMRYSPTRPYGWGPNASSHEWSAPFAAKADRHVAYVTYANISQGVYVCANGGDCVAPDTCVCAPGWIGFDCRTPVCTQGFYDPARPDARYPGQGTYKVSERTVTLWENPISPNNKYIGYIHDHPNFHSVDEDMDARYALPTTHQFTDGLGDDTKEGWRRDGWWSKVQLVTWQHGSFLLRYNRTCQLSSKRQDLRTHTVHLVDDTEYAFKARISYSNTSVSSDGEWNEASGECIDEVQLGCYNKGVCVSPGTCNCAPGWEGDDCSLPVCYQTVGTISTDRREPLTLVRQDGNNVGSASGPPPLPGDAYVQYRQCPHSGNCTRPDTCTCEKGWAGDDCTTPLCAQECFNGGQCVAPDVCSCRTYSSAFLDKRGLALFMKPDGQPQSTGWTGFDCNTPVCVQAPRWVLNDDTGQNIIEFTDSSNDGRVFQGSCPGFNPFTPQDRTRISEELCGNALWYQGNYDEPWSNEKLTSDNSGGRKIRINFPNYVRYPNGSTVYGTSIPGEGIYACYNEGSCTAPDLCSCAAGWSGFDCSVPSCTFINAKGLTIVGCNNGGICDGPNHCSCVQHESLLSEVYPSMKVGDTTGWQAPDCSMPICTQGYFDPDCVDIDPVATGPASAGRGCYRCANGGICTAPDTCKCTTGWSGYDCRTPVCMLRATEEIIQDLKTIDEARIEAFERDPCGQGTMEVYKGRYVARGNCSRPNVCTCLCKRRGWITSQGTVDPQPWHPETGNNAPDGFIYGRYDCIDGFEGALNDDGSFASCHLKIYVPTYWELHALAILLSVSIPTTVCVCTCLIGRNRYLEYQKRKRREERRRKARNLDMDQTGAPKPSAVAAPPAGPQPVSTKGAFQS